MIITSLIDTLINLINSPLTPFLIIFAISFKVLPKSMAPDIKTKFLLSIAGYLFYISFAYYTPEQTKALYDMNSIPLPPAIDTATILFLLLLAWFIYTLMYYSFVILQLASDVIAGAGLKHPESCTSANLRQEGDIGYIRVGGTKPIPIDGSSVWLNPLTHIYKIGTHLLLVARCVQDVSLEHLPDTIKGSVRQQRFDLLGVHDCSPGYLTDSELRTHKEIPKNKFKEFLTDKEISNPKPLYTTTFLTRLDNANVCLDYQVQNKDHENTSTKKHLGNYAAIGKSVQESEKESLWDIVVGGGKK